MNIGDLTDNELILNYKSCVSAETKRAEASTHDKFNKNNPILIYFYVHSDVQLIKNQHYLHLFKLGTL